MNKRASGLIAEQRAAERLEGEGYRIIERNVKVAGVEVDIIAADGRTLVFVEVKSSTYYRTRPSDHLTEEQMRRYVRAAKAYIRDHGLYGVPVRFDVVEVTDEDVTVLKGAFDSSAKR